MRKLVVSTVGLMVVVGFFIITEVGKANEYPPPGANEGGAEGYPAESTSSQEQMMDMSVPSDSSPGLPGGAPAVSQQPPSIPLAKDEEFPASANMDKRKVNQFMNRIRMMEKRIAMLEGRFAMLEGRGGSPRTFSAGMPGGYPGGKQGKAPGMMPPGMGKPMGGKIHRRGLPEDGQTDTESGSEQPASGEPVVSDR